MSQVLTIDRPKHLSKFQHPFLQELIKQIHLRDTLGKYRDSSDELVVNQFIIPSNQKAISEQNITFDPLNQDTCACGTTVCQNVNLGLLVNVEFSRVRATP